MKIIVLLKEVPDTYGERKINLETGLADRSANDAVLDEIGERALEVALTHADDHGDTEVVILTMGPASASASLRRGLAMGARSALHIQDDALLGADMGTTAEVLAAGIRHAGFDLVIAGNQSTDGSGGVIPVMIAERLGVPAATYLDRVEIADDEVRGVRAGDTGTIEMSAKLPAVISVTERVPEARFPSLRDSMAAKRKPLEALTAEDLGVDPGDESRAHSIVIAVAERARRQAGVKIIDEGDAGERLADYLVNARLT